MRGFKLVLLAIAVVVSVPMAAFAQATLSGLVRDTSGAVLPGVTVEASSPVLIEKVRSGVTDGTGRYTIPDLRPGTYRLTFSLTGFKTVVREGVELSGTAVLHGQRRPARSAACRRRSPSSGETPVVDLQSTTRQAVMDQEIVSRDPELAHTLHRRRADPRRAQGRVHGPGRRRLGRAGSRLARSQRRPHRRTSA